MMAAKQAAKQAATQYTGLSNFTATPRLDYINYFVRLETTFYDPRF